jgi:hypothetical protein
MSAWLVNVTECGLALLKLPGSNPGGGLISIFEHSEELNLQILNEHFSKNGAKTFHILKISINISETFKEIK